MQSCIFEFVASRDEGRTSIMPNTDHELELIEEDGASSSVSNDHMYENQTPGFSGMPQQNEGFDKTYAVSQNKYTTHYCLLQSITSTG